MDASKPIPLFKVSSENCATSYDTSYKVKYYNNYEKIPDSYDTFIIYGEVDFKEVLHTHGDSYDRVLMRIDEIKQAVHIIRQLIDNIPAGEYKQKTKPIIKLPEGRFSASVEGSRGEFGVFIESHGDKNPYRVKFRPMGLPLIASMHKILKGCKIADLITIGATLDYVIPDIDR